jgi:hypothetical protein
MSILEVLRSNPSSQGKFAESSGYYDRIPIRVNEFTLVENSEGLVIFETTAREFCRNGPKLQIRISDSSDWSVTQQHGSYGSGITPSVDLHDERLARRRAMWHAAQEMAGRELSASERFSTLHQVYEDDADLFEDDAFFQRGDAITNDPFGEFLEDK